MKSTPEEPLVIEEKVPEPIEKAEPNVQAKPQPEIESEEEDFAAGFVASVQTQSPVLESISVRKPINPVKPVAISSVEKETEEGKVFVIEWIVHACK